MHCEPPEITGFRAGKDSVGSGGTGRTARGPAQDTTINRDLDALRGVLSKAIEWGVITAHPMKPVRDAKVDTLGRLRYLTPDEEKRLRAALEARERRDATAAGVSTPGAANAATRPFPSTARYPDHITPITLLALNTGLRRGELLALTWRDVDLVQLHLTVQGATAKSGLTRYVPLNTEASTR